MLLPVGKETATEGLFVAWPAATFAFSFWVVARVLMRGMREEKGGRGAPG